MKGQPMALSAIITEPISITTTDSVALTYCGFCDKKLPLSHTIRRFKVEGSLMNLSFCTHRHAFLYEYERRHVPPRDDI